MTTLLRDFAATLCVAFIGFGVAGALWGLWYPETQFTVAPEHTLELVKQGADFTAYCVFMVVSGLLAAVLGLWTLKTRIRRTRMLLWLGVVAVAASWLFYFVGVQVVELRTSHTTDVGDVVTVFHVPDPGVALLVSPLLALLVYWVGALNTDSDSWVT